MASMMTETKPTKGELQQAVFASTATANAADDAWQAQLDAAKVDRYSAAARKVEGYDAKLKADAAMRQANDALRAFNRRVSVNGRH